MSTIKKVLVLGSGAIKIGEAGEFDYSGSQCLKALKEEKIETILVNPNIATIQTSLDLAKKIYFLPITPFFVEKIIQQERPQGILLGFGGQTALNCGLGLAKRNVFNKFGVRVLGTPIKAIEQTEDRQLFVSCLRQINLLTPKSEAARNTREATQAAKKIGFPLILRVGFALGGLGSKVVKNYKEFEEAVGKALSSSPQVLVEEYLGGWKEIEYEVVRDAFDNCITVCNMENLDPMGIHTGESIVVAPSQTLTNTEYYYLRRLSIKLVKQLGIIGECNIQFAVNPEKFEYRIIEVNARLSRSSALASKATGYPLALVATKLALGHPLYEIENKITCKTKSFFEPALDYLALKFPRWDLDKFKNVNQLIGSEMKSVGEVMALDRDFPACLQKAIRMLNNGQNDLLDSYYQEFKKSSQSELESYLTSPTPKRIFAMAAALARGLPVSKINSLTGIDPWFLVMIKKIIDFDQQKIIKLDNVIFKAAKKLGFSNDYLSQRFKKTPKQISGLKRKYKIAPAVKQIDTVAAEFPAKTNYLYLTYTEKNNDLTFNKKNKIKKKVLVLGSGPYCIGSSVEFDWCAVNAARCLAREGFESIMVNCNPETVSTDFDIGNKLYFEELTYERIKDICDLEKPDYLILSFGGQIPNNLAADLAKIKIPILGTRAEDIDRAEDRNKFSRLLDKLKIEQPAWQSFTQKEQAFEYAKKIGFPVLVRPSYVLSGAAMFVAYSSLDLEQFLERTLKVSRQFPVVISKFIDQAFEIDVDGVAKNGQLITRAICEHVENAGVHSGDATLVFPPQKLTFWTLTKLDQTTEKIVKALNITGPFNIQYLTKNGDVMVIECNLRASRSFPFISKVSGTNFVDLAIQAMLGKNLKRQEIIKLPYVGVKSAQFSFTRLKGADPVLRVEMASTGEVATIGTEFYDAFLKSLMATGFTLPKKRILLSIGGDENKYAFLESARILESKYLIFATSKTYSFLRKNRVKAKPVFGIDEKKSPSVLEVIKARKVDLVINISDKKDLGKVEFQNSISGGYYIRRTTADYNIPLITNLETATLFVKAINKKDINALEIKSWDEYLKNINTKK